MRGLFGSAARLPSIVGACVCAGVLAFTAGPAQADGGHPAYPNSSLAISITPPPAGDTFAVTATGSNDEIDQLGEPVEYDLYVFLVDPTVDPACEPDEIDELGDSGAYLLSIDGDIDASEGFSGPFTLNIGVQLDPSFSGPLLICAYSLWSDFDTAASAVTSTTIGAAVPPPTGTPPPPPVTSPAPAPPPAPTLPPTAPQPSLPLRPTPRGKAPKTTIPAANALRKPKVIFRPRVDRLPGTNTLICLAGTWLELPTSYSFSWAVPHHRGSLGHKSTYKFTRAMRGGKITCSVSVSNSAGKTRATSPVTRIK